MSFDSSVLFPLDNTKECCVLELSETENTSLYVPVIPPNLLFASSESNEPQKFQPKFLKYYIENCMRIGKVRRIDFATREVPHYTTPQICAFIHFDCLYNNESTLRMRTDLQNTGKHLSCGFNAEDKYCNFQHAYSSNKTAHLLFKINHKPIETPKEYTRNIEQVMAENKLLIEKVQEKDEIIRQLMNDLQALKEHSPSNINNMESILYQRIDEDSSTDILNSTIYPNLKDDDNSFPPLTIEDLM
jgi:hypothetical protein